MSSEPPAPTSRCAVVDLGSNSVRLVVYEGRCRNPVAMFNEKAVLRLGRGLQATGRLNEETVGQAITVMRRYQAVARAMGADPLEVLATAAVRDAANGPEFVRRLAPHLPGVPIRILSGSEEGEYSALGVICGIPEADGILAGIGGGSLELVRLQDGQPGRSHTVGLGVIRLAERAGNDPERARDIADADLSGVGWLKQGEGRDLYLVGGAWRALARVHMSQVGYPLHMVHHYTIGREEARELAGMVAGSGRRALERLPGVPRRRIEDLPYAAVVLRRVLRATSAARVVFSANGLREGWFMQQIPDEVRAEDPLLAAGRDYARWLGRDATLPPDLIAWTDPLFPRETIEGRRLAGGRMLDVRPGQPRPSGVPCRASVPARAASARRGTGSLCSGVSGTGDRAALRSRGRHGIFASGTIAAGCRQRTPGGGAGDRTAAGLHAVGRHARPAGGDRVGSAGQPVGAAAG